MGERWQRHEICIADFVRGCTVDGDCGIRAAAERIAEQLSRFVGDDEPMTKTFRECGEDFARIAVGPEVANNFWAQMRHLHEICDIAGVWIS